MQDFTSDDPGVKDLGIKTGAAVCKTAADKNGVPKNKAKKLRYVPVLRIRPKKINGREFYYAYWYECGYQRQEYLGTAEHILRKVKGK